MTLFIFEPFSSFTISWHYYTYSFKVIFVVIDDAFGTKTLGCMNVEVKLSAEPRVRALLLLSHYLLMNVQLRRFLELLAAA